MQAIKKSLLKAVLALSGVCFLLNTAQAQFEPQFTQYMFNEMFINPAYAGSRDNISLTGAYRNQWVGIEGAPITQTLSGHAPLKNKKIGVGLSLMNEKIGVTHDMALFANYAYRIPMKRNYWRSTRRMLVMFPSRRTLPNCIFQMPDSVYIISRRSIMQESPFLGCYRIKSILLPMIW